MKINLYGIEFEHRRPTANDYVFKDFAQFGAFAALCHARGIAKHVKRVFFCHNFNGYQIELHADGDLLTAEREIRACAESALFQFELGGFVGGYGLV